MKEVHYMKTPTVHIGAKKGEIAESILLPGDPLRARFIAENFLSNPSLYSEVRGMCGYTGLYKGVKVSVQGTGMGAPSMGIYSHELIHAYDVKRLIRIGSAGALQDHLHLGDVIAVMSASYDAHFTLQYNLPGIVAPAASYQLLKKADQEAQKDNITLHMGSVLTSDVFYNRDPHILRTWREMGLLAVEMEAASLYFQAQWAQREALALLTISDLPFGDAEMSSLERERSLTTMITLALNVATK
jgi:purine-nucleoside phosphorylase